MQTSRSALTLPYSSNAKEFASIGVIYALGDIFEMDSANYIDSSTYTVLLQPLLIIKAPLMWVLDGAAPSMMQWFTFFHNVRGHA